ncbi:MAG: GntR family transcriptional regulator, partial [Lentisphaeria bacterium]|nr:GntR family transcriptional regulator [Lentisphaeria bacterium]
MKNQLKRTQEDPVPLYFQLINQMRREILVQLKPGDPIPSERVLCQHFNICRTTVRQALEQLT